jgi:capsid protein
MTGFYLLVIIHLSRQLSDKIENMLREYVNEFNANSKFTFLSNIVLKGRLCVRAFNLLSE